MKPKSEDDDGSPMASKKSIGVFGIRKKPSGVRSVSFKTYSDYDSIWEENEFEQTKLDSMEMMAKVSFYLENYTESFMCNLLIVLFKARDEDLCCILLQYYNVIPQEDFIAKWLENNWFKVLRHIWKYNKNKCYIPGSDLTQYFTYIDLINFLKKQYEESNEYERYLKLIADWKLESKDNFLKALLYHEYEQMAIDLMGYYFHDMTKELLIFCLDHGKEKFFSKSLELAAFNKFIFKNDDVVNKFLELLKSGTNTNYYLNILTLVDIALWKTNKIKELIEIFEQYASESYENNQLLLSYNPLMTIALAWETLTHISNHRKKLENQASKVRKDLLALGQMFSSKIEDEDYYEQLVTDTDFRGRSLLKIITDLEFEPLMDEKDPKAENIMMSIYQGKETARWDGNIKGYSSIYHVVTTRPKKIASDKFKWFVFFKNYFEPNYEFDYNFQYRYRAYSINFIFMKEFICALGLLIIFQYINYQYLSLFNIDDLKDKTEEQKISELNDNIETYRNYNILAFLFSFSLIAQFMLKMIFNSWTTSKKLPFDKWTIVDTVSALLYIWAIFVVSNLTAEDFLDEKGKDWIDYFMLLVLCMSWIRFFSFFLVIRDISKLLLTLVAMVTDTLAFILIVTWFLIIMSSVFTTLYQDYNEDKYGNLSTSFRTLFDTALAVYDYEGMGSRDLSHSILLIFVAFLTNVLLLNFIIAILSTTYENMKESGIFKYKSNLFKYWEKYLIAMKSDYKELVLQPAPLAYFWLVLIPFTPSIKLIKSAGKKFSYGMYWLENVLFIMIFILFELLISPLMYVKTFYNIWFIPQSMLTRIFVYIAWFFGGYIFVFFLILYDTKIFINILKTYEGHQTLSEEDKNLKKIDKKKIYNQLRSVMVTLYHRKKNELSEQDDDPQSDNVKSLDKSITPDK
jgi:hypothetical protein